MLSFRNLSDPGGLGFSDAQVVAVAAEYKVKDIDDLGNPVERAGRPADHFPAPFANQLAATAAGRPGYLRRWLAADARAIRQGRCGFHGVGGRAAHGRAQAHRLPGHDLPDRAGGPLVFQQEEGVGGPALRGTKSLDAGARFWAPLLLASTNWGGR